MVEYIKSHKRLTAVIAAVLVLAIVSVSLGVYISKRGNGGVRTLALTERQLDLSSILDGFEDVSIVTEGGVCAFSGSKTFETEDDTFPSTVKYNCSYDGENNIVTMSAVIYLPNGEIEENVIYGVGFTNEDGELDAVMNLGDGDIMTLSQMRDLGLIANVGWNFWKTLAVVFAVVAVVAACVCIPLAVAGGAALAVTILGITAAVSAAASVGTGINGVVVELEGGAKRSITTSIADVPTKEGYRFLGYFDQKVGGTKYYDENGVYVLESASNSGSRSVGKEDKEVTLYAQWEAIEYTLTFERQNGTAAVLIKVTFDEGLPIIEKPEREGYVFYGYFDCIVRGERYYNADGTSAKEKYDTAANVTLFAQWQYLQ